MVILHVSIGKNQSNAYRYFPCFDLPVNFDFSYSNIVLLIILDPPDVIVTTKNTTSNGTGVDIECWAAGEPPNYTFSPWRQTWPGTNVVVRNQINFTSTDQPSERLLHIPFPNYQDTGVYTCTVGNGIATGNTGVVMNTGSVYLLVKCKYFQI